MDDPLITESLLSSEHPTTRQDNNPPWSYYHNSNIGVISPKSNMSSDTPSWLSNDTSSDPVPASSAPVTSRPQGVATDVSSSPHSYPTTANDSVAAPSLVNDEKLSHMILVMRLTNMAAMVALTTCSILKMLSFPTLASWVLAFYAVFTGTLVFCLETQLKFIRVMIAMNFGFLFNPLLRFLYYTMMASIAWSFENIFGQIVAASLIAIAIYNTYVLVAYPDYRRVREQIALEEDKRLEKNIQKRVQREAVKQATNSWNEGKV